MYRIGLNLINPMATSTRTRAVCARVCVWVEEVKVKENTRLVAVRVAANTRQVAVLMQPSCPVMTCSNLTIVTV